MRATRLIAAVAAAILCSVMAWYLVGREQTLSDGLEPGRRIQCASWTPLEGDETPQVMRVVPERIERDFRVLAERFRCVRIYSIQGMESVPDVARRHGLKLIAGAWINASDTDSDAEVAALIGMANRHPDVVETVLVGNEVLLRRERTSAEMTAYIRRVRGAVDQPVGYGDVWEFWLQHPALAAEVDVVAIHLLPYWENQPTGIDGAIQAVAHAHDRVARAFPGKDILIGETGWPSEGRQRQQARPGRVNAARFMRGFIRRAEAEGWRYNLIEAFDQPWKRAQEGAVGGYWGLFDGDRRDKHLLAGPVSDLPLWPVWLALALGFWLLLVVAAGKPAPVPVMVMAVVTNGVAWHLQRMSLYSRDAWESVHYLLVAVLALACALQWSRRQVTGMRSRGYDGVLLAVLMLLTIDMLRLAFDPRYRDFPVAVFAVPVGLMAASGFASMRLRACAQSLGGVLAVCIPAVAWQETLSNPVAVAWILICAVAAFACWRRPADAQSLRGVVPGSAKASSASTPATEPRSAL